MYPVLYLDSANMFHFCHHFFLSGCVSRLLINGKPQVLAPTEVKKRYPPSSSFSSTSVGAVVGVTGCETCAEAPCRNGGVCQEDNTDRGYR